MKLAQVTDPASPARIAATAAHGMRRPAHPNQQQQFAPGTAVGKFRLKEQTIMQLTSGETTTRNHMLETMNSWRSTGKGTGGQKSIASKVNPRFMQSFDLGSLDEN